MDLDCSFRVIRCGLGKNGIHKRGQTLTQDQDRDGPVQQPQYERIATRTIPGPHLRRVFTFH